MGCGLLDFEGQGRGYHLFKKKKKGGGEAARKENVLSSSCMLKGLLDFMLEWLFKAHRSQ